ncbi:MAG TPA: NgoFVII family restriction endonuclease [Saprospiraceae bacterium]|nr:NgoFVII family restriction endonuclease [Saprospiraceae bacterium]
MIVGTHFYQTHPDFIKEFIESNKVRFIINSSGIYHPKFYLFSNNKKDWECLVGSANFTKSAFSKNSEVVIHINSLDNEDNNIFHSLKKSINDYWHTSNSISENDYYNYRNIWKLNNSKIKKLKGNYGNLKKSKSLIKSDVFSKRWNDYYSQISSGDSFQRRIELLNIARGYFTNFQHFSDLDDIKRKEIAGTIKANDWGWFGSMIGAGKFKNRINTNNAYISQALDSIPLKEKIYKINYIEYINLFQQAFPDGGDGIALATRLLAMKRPDIFVCLDSKNKKNLCQEFGISQSVDYESYWDDIIERIYDSVWWNSEKPLDTTEISAWKGRVAMLDSVFYEW